MSALTEKIAAEHRWTLGEFLATNGTTYEWPSCACGLRLDDDDSPDHELHVAEVTEAAVRAQIAAEITTQTEIDEDQFYMLDSVRNTYLHAARIAKGTP